MEQEPLSNRNLEKLEAMTEEGKLKLFYRLKIIALNKRISKILADVVGEDNIRAIKTRIVHQLYDQNLRGEMYDEVQAILEGDFNFYDTLDVYTIAAYYKYYSKLISYAHDAKKPIDVESAMIKAYNSVRSEIAPRKLKVGCEQTSTNWASLLKSKYREAVFEYLRNTLRTTDVNKLNALSNYGEEECGETPIKRSPTKSIMNVERYVGTNGEVYYLDYEGECYSEDEVDYD